MRILFVTSVYEPSVSGITVSMQNFKRELEARGHDVWVLAPKYPGWHDTDPHVIRYPSVRNPLVRAYPIPLPVPTPVLIAFLATHRFDIVHTHHPLYIGAFARLIAFFNRAPVVFTHHTRYDAPFLPILDNRAVAQMLPRAVDRFCEQVDLVIAPSAYIASYLSKKKKDMNVVVIPSPISAFDMRAGEHDPYQGFPKENAVKCLMVQRLTFEKKTDFAVEALAVLPEHYHLFIVGDGPARSSIEARAEELGIGARVHITGFMDRAQVADFLAHADVFLFTSTTETQSMGILEAASWGLPMVVADSEFSRSVLPDGVCVRAPLNPELFAKAVLLALRGRQKLGDRARVWSKEFSPGACANALEQRYETCVKIKAMSETGWQSWSAKNAFPVRLPTHRFNPLGKDNYALPAELWLAPPRKQPGTIAGWCSWGAYGTGVTETVVLENAQWMADHRGSLPLEYCLIDDGWTRWGDWRAPSQEKFPQGLIHLAREIHNRGLKAGIWMAPFLASARSQTFRQFPAWFARDESGFPVDGAQFHPFVGIPFLKPVTRRLLDTRMPGAWEHVRHSIDFLLRTCGFDLIKLDFLFAPYFIPGISVHEASEMIQRVLRYVKGRYPQVYVIGCGCPLVDGVGLVDAMRVGPDAVLPWMRNAGALGAVWYHQTIDDVDRTVRSRMWTKDFWTLDPDNFMCASAHPVVRTDVLRMQKLVKDCNGVIFLGDRLSTLTEQHIHEYINPLFS